MNVAIIGASNNPDRYAYLAQQRLSAYGHRVFPVTPKAAEVMGAAAYASIEDVPQPIDTATIYVGPPRLSKIADAIIAKSPKRLILNPGAEAPDLEERFTKAGIRVVKACTLVLLSSGRFEDA